MAPLAQPPAPPAAEADGHVAWRRRLLDPFALSIALALVFTVAGLVELLVRGPVPAGHRPDDTLLIVLTVLASLTLALLWWSPLASLSLVAAALCAQAVLDYEITQATAWVALVASFATVTFDRWPRAVAAGFVVAAGLLLVFVTSPAYSWRTAVSTWVTFSVVWAVGVAIRVYRTSAAQAQRRAALFEADREARAREAVRNERARLARELHDSVGHALNVVVLHAGAARRVVEKDPGTAREALDNIETTGRQALNDIERMLGVLRSQDEEAEMDAQPGLGQLDVLVDQVREAGQAVSVTVEGEPHPLPASLDLTAYRVVQEALTNVLKHAGGARAEVRLRYDAGDLTVEVLDHGRGAAAPGASTQGGRGLAGMRERVLIFGGDLQAGPRPEGGFAVRARLPLTAEEER